MTMKHEFSVVGQLLATYSLIPRPAKTSILMSAVSITCVMGMCFNCNFLIVVLYMNAYT